MFKAIMLMKNVITLCKKLPKMKTK